MSKPPPILQLKNKKEYHLAIIDMESKLTKHIEARLNELGVAYKLYHWKTMIKLNEVKGFIISGSSKVIQQGKPTIELNGGPYISKEILDLNLPVLGICYGLQWLAHTTGSRMVSGPEHGYVIFNKLRESRLFYGLGNHFPVYMKHDWRVNNIHPSWSVIGNTNTCPVGAIEKNNFFGLQWHPEHPNSAYGRIVLNNFCNICGLKTKFI